MNFKVIGTEAPRPDGREKVTGAAVFVADLRMPGMLHARVLRSGQAHARLRRVDVSRAQALDGVKAVVTGARFQRPFGICITDQFPLARDKVRFAGEPVAAVIAVSEQVADEALKLIEVEYDPLPVVLDPREAIRPGAPLLHEDLGSYARVAGINPCPGTNIFHHFKIRRGELEETFHRADHVVDREYEFPSVHHVQLEPHGAIARLSPGGDLTVWSSSQAPFVVRHTVSRLLGLPASKVRVVVPYVGGGFGGKSDVTIEPLAACLATAVPGRAVRLVLAREEMFDGTVIGRGLYARYRTAVTREGRIIGEEILLTLNGGGYGDYAVNIVGGAAASATGPYEIPNLKIDAYGLYTNTPPTGACRGYGHPEVHWACERQREIIAREMGIDPVEFRLRNILGPGKSNALGQIMEEDHGRVDLCIRKVVEDLAGPRYFAGRGHGPGGRPAVRRGKGIAAFMKAPVMPTNAQSGAIIRLNEDGGATVSVGAVEMGQGTYTALGQIAAEALRLPVEMVRVVPFVDTEVSPYEWQTVASHTTWAVGNAILMAAADVLDQLKVAAGAAFGVSPEELEAGEGKIFLREAPVVSLPYSRLALGCTRSDGSAVNRPVIGRGTFVPSGLTYPDPETGQGNPAADWTFGCQGAEVEVDLRTGEITVLKLVTAIDAGRIINPLLARGQVLGAAAQALGSTLFEKLIYSEAGIMRNRSLTDYKIPGPEDMPLQTRVIFVETPEKTGPYGARGLGEHGTVGVPPAIGNALANALGADFYALPITAADVIRALKGKGGGLRAQTF
ncbi:MAG: xanthine dehydrogenase family protein molybdopterin-binding subunit [Firmicutes bacterium]|nr:xanthine dehydrogenase family protein molybdopterin-binding subunit [Bacillota bacterium]